MYSVVIMAALTTTPAVPEFGRRGGCHGCYGGYACCGCYGGYASACYGGYGYGCSGCWGGYGSCSGCSGCSGCWGGYGYGCWGGCSNGWGYSYPAYSSYLCTANVAGIGCYGYGCTNYYNYGYGCGGYGCGGCYGSGGFAYGYAPAFIAPAGGATTPTRPAERIPGPGDKGGTNGGGRASSITVTLPEGAQLFVDGKTTDVRSNTQQFTTPALAPGQMYAYTFRAEVTRDGRAQSETQRVVFRPGETVRVSFPNLAGTPTQTASR